MLIVGIIPFAISLFGGICDSVNGFSGMCFIECNYYYGFEALIDSIFIYFFIFWPTYIVGIILMIISIMNIRRK